MATHATVLVINNNGRHGAHGERGYDGSHGVGYGVDGSPGGRGADGEDAGAAGSIQVWLTGDNSAIYIKDEEGPKPGGSGASHNFTMIMGDPRNELVMSAVGGDGGHGGRGGDGGSGAGGYPGRDATRSSNGTNGGPGGDGGSGGRGGDGGNAGDGNYITVNLPEMDMDTLMIMRQRVSKTHAGNIGHGGSGGSGGSGGPGGRGGSSYSWSETSSYTDSNGNTQYTTTSYTNPGGYSGPSGRSGHDGASGSDGRHGVDGIFKIQLTRDSGMMETYPSPYDLQVNFQWVVDTIGYQVIEPACQTHTMVSHTNVGGMPTPSHQLIRGYVADNQWIFTAVECRVPLQTWITPTCTSLLSKPILSLITDVNEPAYGDPFKVTAYLEHRALVDRVNQDFERVRNVSTPFTIEFPVQNSLFKGGLAVKLGEEAPMVFSVTNISALSIGKAGQGGPARVLATTIRVLPGTAGGSKNGETLAAEDIRLRNADGIKYDKWEEGLQSQIPVLTAGQKQYFASTLEFTNVDMKPYTRVSIESSLHLGHVQNMMAARNIQIRPFEVQLAEGYSHSSSADILIVVNNRTEYDEMVAWRKICSQIGSRFGVWNVHLYGDLKLDHVRQDGRTLLQDFHCGTIVFLNNLCLRDEKLDQNCVEYARSHEIFLAARDLGINVLVHGSEGGIDLKRELVPAIHNPRIVYYKTRKTLLDGMRKRLQPGEGYAQALPANTDQASLCGVLKVDKKKFWCVLIIGQKTLGLYKSAKQQYPDKMIYLSDFEVKTKTDENQTSLGFDIVTPVRVYSFTAPAEKEYKGKHTKYGTRSNYVEGCTSWISRLMEIAGNMEYTLSGKIVVAPAVESAGVAAPSIADEMAKLEDDIIIKDGADVIIVEKEKADDVNVDAKKGDDAIKESSETPVVKLEKSDVKTEKSEVSLKKESVEISKEGNGDDDVAKEYDDAITKKEVDEVTKDVDDVITPVMEAGPSGLSSSAPVFSAASPSHTSSSLALLSSSVPVISAADNFEGELYKGGGVFGSYSKCYFVVNPLAKTITFSAKKDGEVKGTIYMGRYTIRDKTKSAKSSLFKFQVLTPDVRLKLGAESKEEKNRWIFSIATRILPTETASVFSDQNTAMKSTRISTRLSSMGLMAPSGDDTAMLLGGSPLEHNTVVRIPIEERFIITKPKEDHMKKKAKRMHKALQHKFPNQRNVIVYRFNEQFKDTKRGFMIHHIGELEVHRSLDATTPHIVTTKTEADADVHNPDVVTAPPTRYALIKVQPFLRKLVLLDEAVGNTLSPIEVKENIVLEHAHIGSLVMNAILSDIADELHYFHKPSWRAGLNTGDIIKQLRTFSELKNFKFAQFAKLSTAEERLDSVLGVMCVELVMHIIEISKAFHNVWDLLLPFRRSSYVTRAASKLGLDILLTWLVGVDAQTGKPDPSKWKTIKSEVQKRIKDKKITWKTTAAEKKIAGYEFAKPESKKIKNNKKHALKHYFGPQALATGCTDTHVEVPKIMPYREFIHYFGAHRPDEVVEGRYLFKDDEARENCVNKIQQSLQCPTGAEKALRTHITPNIYPI